MIIKSWYYPKYITTEAEGTTRNLAILNELRLTGQHIDGLLNSMFEQQQARPKL